MNESDASRWNAPEFGAPRPARTARVETPPPAPVKVGPSVEELAAIEKAARDEGFAQGKKEGLAAAEAEVNRLKQQLGALLKSLSQPLAEFDGEVAQALGELATQIAGALLQEAYRAEPARLARLIDTALAGVAEQRSSAEVHLHPADLALLNQQIDLGATRLLGDASCKRGDVRIHTPILRIDGSLEARLRSALAALDDDGESA